MNGIAISRAGSLLGVALTLALSGLLVVAQADDPDTGMVWGLAMGLGYLSPFALAELAIGLRTLRRRGPVFVGAGVAGLLLAFSSVVGVTVPLIIPAFLLIVGGVRQLPSEEAGGLGWALTYTVGPIVAGIGSLFSFFASASLGKLLLTASLSVWALLAIRLISLARNDQPAEALS